MTRGSNVDESLFGDRTTSKANRKVPSNAVVISKSELVEMQKHSKIWTAHDEEARVKKLEDEQEDKARKAKERKQRMLKLEEQAVKKAQKSEMEMERDARKETIRKLANEDMDSNLDLVKMLNTLGARAAAFTIRDKQLEEKKEREKQAKSYEEKWDVLMEIDRLEDLKKRESTEIERRLKRIEDRKVIIEQIEARKKRDLLAEEHREQENKAMLNLVEKYKQEDRKLAELRAKQVKAAREEVVAANEAAIQRKKLAKSRERAEEESILLYQARKDEQLRKREKEEAEKDRLVKERQAKLLAAQEKTQNTQAEVDELRARRYAEAKERQDRERDLSELKLRKQRIAELQDAHFKQAEQKKRMLAREALTQQQEYEAGLKHSAFIIERERKEAADRAEKSAAHRRVLQQQIADSEAAKSLAARQKFDEGRQLKSEFAAERAKLEAIREKMVADMTKKGINPQYLAEIQNANLAKLLGGR